MAKRPRDPNALVFQIMRKATDQAPKYNPDADERPKNPNAVALGRLGGLKGGHARAAALGPRKRTAIAAAAAKAR